MKYFLITTALEETWRDDKPVLFLGEWCRLFSRKKHWANMEAEVLPYHWADRNKFTEDYKYLSELYERLLKDLSCQLNLIHEVDHSLRYWRILVGPWLAYFLQMLFDRWCNIENAVMTYDLSETIVITINQDTMVPNDMEHLNQLMVDDEWNHYIFSLIIEHYTKIPIFRQAYGDTLGARTRTPGVTHRVSYKTKLASWYSRAVRALVRDDDAFFIQTYLPFRHELRLHCQFGQIPQLWFSEQPVRVEVDWQQRKWGLVTPSRTAFEEYASALISKQIPTLYIEGYEQLMEQVERLRWPKRPKIIFTSGALWHDMVSMAYISEKVENGALLAYGQHGGVYGSAKFSWAEEHELAISDRYMSWGWTEPSRSHITPIGILKEPCRIKRSTNANSYALLVLTSQNRYSARLDSDPKSSQFADQIDSAFLFAEALPPSIKDQLIVRLYMHEYGWQHMLRWQERCPGVTLDAGRSKMKDSLKNARIAIFTNNSTGYLEAFSSGLPAILFWDPAAYPLRESAVPYFNGLSQVGIFHQTPESAARHVATVWNDVDDWWRSTDVQAVLTRFIDRYCAAPSDMFSRIYVALQEMVDPIPAQSDVEVHNGL